MRGDNIIRWGASVPWSILPESLEQMVSFVTREKLTTKEAIDLVAAKTGMPMKPDSMVRMRDGIAVIDVIGPIFRYADAFSAISGANTLDQLSLDYNEALNNPNVKGIVLNIDSPGGEATGIGEFAAMLGASRDKPVVAYVGGSCCSAAYWIAAAADSIIAAPTAMIGSIGAVMTVPVKQNDGTTVEFVSSQSPNKRPDVQTEGGRQHVQERVDALAQVFIDDVARLRNMSPKTVADTQGGVFIAGAAQKIGLIDSLGTFEGLIADMCNPQQSKKGKMDMANNGRMAQFMAWLSGEDVQAGAEAIPAAAAAPVSATAENTEFMAKMAAELEVLRAERAEANTRALRAEAMSFSKEIITAGRAFPAEQADLIDLYMILANDDAQHGNVTAADGAAVSRLDRFKAAMTARTPHNLVAIGNGDTVAKVVTNNVVTAPEVKATFSGERPALTAERRAHLLSFTEEGKEVAKAKGLLH